MSEEAFERFYKENLVSIRNYIQVRVRKEDVEDLVQEVFALAWEKREIIEFHENPCAWLKRTAKYKVLEQFRKYQRSMISFETLDWRLGSKAGGQGMAEMVYFMDEYLSPMDLRFFLAIYLEGRTLEEMARIAGVSKECMRLWMERDKKLLRDGLSAKQKYIREE